MLRGLILALLLPLLLALLRLEGVAWADDPLAQARQAVAESDYVSARPALVAALQAGGHGPDDVAEIYRLTGIVEAALGDARAATEAFTHLLALSPKAALPAGTSPKIKRPFDAAAKFIEAHAALEVKSETAARPPAITLVVVSDPLNMIAQVRAVFSVDGGPEATRDAEVTEGDRTSAGEGPRVTEGDRTSAGEGPGGSLARGNPGGTSERTEIALPNGRRIDARLAALDRYGNRLAEIGSKEVPIVIIGDAPPPAAVAPPVPRSAPVTVRAAPRPLYLRWWPYATATAVFSGVTLYFAWQVHADTDELDRLNADSAPHPFGDARAVEDRARREVLFTNIGLGITGACALATGILYLTRPHDRVETRVTAVPLRGGGAVALGGAF